MSKLINIFIVFLFTTFFGCSDESQSNELSNSEKPKLEASAKSEKIPFLSDFSKLPKEKREEIMTSLSEKFNPKQKKDTSEIIKKDIKNVSGKNFNVNIKNKKIKVDYQSPRDLVVGVWSGTIEGDKKIWAVYRDGTEKYSWYHSEYTQTDVGEWSTHEDILYEKYSKGGKTICKLQFETKNHLILTVLDNGNPQNKNQKRHYYRITETETRGENRSKKRTESSENAKTTCVYCYGKKTKTCHYCNGAGKVENVIQRERWNNITQSYELYSETETQICQACTHGQIKCNVCNGKGKY